MYSRLILIFGIICLFGNTMSVPTPEPVKNDERALELLSREIQQFSWKLHKTVSEDQKDNLIMSGVSANIVLAMAGYGARQNTLQQMKSVLSLSNNDILDQRGYQKIIDQFNNIKDVTLNVANKMFLSEDLPLKKSYEQLTGDIFRSASEQVDFKNTIDAVNKINNFCENNTNGRIKELVTAGDIDESTKMFLVNALYFKGNWEEKFDSGLTMDMPFRVDNNTVKNVSTMYKEGEFNYGDIEEMDACFVEIPYKGKRFSMVVILPNTMDGLDKINEKLAGMNMNDMLKKGSGPVDVQLHLPKFKIESTLSLTEYLQEMGMTDAFTNKANFTGISEVPLQISAVIQKAFIEVNEEGSEAAAVTEIGIVFMSLPPPPKVIKVDHPFVYLILDTSLNVVLFSGHVRMPSM